MSLIIKNISWNDWKITQYEMPSKPAYPSQDESLVSVQNNTLRVAAIDGMTPSDKCPEVEGVDGARYAAHKLRMHLTEFCELDEALEMANQALMGEFDDLIYARHRPAAGCSALDIKGDSMKMIAAMDCEIWIKRRWIWELALGSLSCSERAKQDVMDWIEKNPDHTLASLVSYEAQVVNDPDVWLSTPIGMFTDLNIQTREITLAEIQEIIVCSDGARFAHIGDSEVSDWVQGLRSWENANAERVLKSKPSDDVTVIHLVRCV